MRINGGLLCRSDSEWLELRRKWSSWNTMHPLDQVDWNEYYDEHRK